MWVVVVRLCNAKHQGKEYNGMCGTECYLQSHSLALLQAATASAALSMYLMNEV